MLKQCGRCEKFQPFGGQSSGWCESTAPQSLRLLGYPGARVVVRHLADASGCPEFDPAQAEADQADIFQEMSA